MDDSAIINQINRIAKAISFIDVEILSEPTGEQRNKLTSASIHLRQSLYYLDKVLVKE